MKALALALAVACLTMTATLASAHQRQAPTTASFSFRMTMPTLHGLTVRRVVVPLVADQVSGTATPTATSGTTGTPVATGTPVTTGTVVTTPQPTATTSPYPDPVQILQQSIQLYSQITSTHFTEVYTGVKTNVEKLVTTAKGAANCKPGMLATVTGTDKLIGTSQQRTLHYKFEQLKKNYWKQNLKGKGKHKWVKTTANKTSAWGLAWSTPLFCSSTSSTGGSGGTDTLTDVKNLGPLSYHGQSVWHVQATDVVTDSSGTQQSFLLDFYITKSHLVWIGAKETIVDQTNNVTITYEEIHTKIGSKVNIKAIKVKK